MCGFFFVLIEMRSCGIIVLVLLGAVCVWGHAGHGHAPPAPGATPPPPETMGFHDTSLTQDEAYVVYYTNLNISLIINIFSMISYLPILVHNTMKIF